jgi:hypothetical protein
MSSPYPARLAAGPAGGVLAGNYPNPASGLPIGGLSLYDDFVGDVLKAALRTQLPWKVGDLGGGVTLVERTDTATEIGIMDVYTGTTLADGGNVYLDSSKLIGGIPVGLTWAVKIRANTTAHGQNVRVWSGFAETANGDWLISGSVNCVGIRAISSGATVNWYGVVKDGSTATNESTVDLGVTYDTPWQILGFRRTATGIQFFRADASELSRYGLLVDDVGAEVTTNIPTSDLVPVAVGLRNATAALKSVWVDFWACGGAISR